MKQYVIGPTVQVLILETLPKPNTRWVPRRKAEVIHAVQLGLLTSAQAKAKYNLTEAEYADWVACYDKFGLAGLRTTQYQQYHAK